MPTYEFACSSCDDRIELLLRIDEEPPTTCEVCGGTLRKVFHPVGVVLKGSGFYKTDSRGNGKPAKKDAPKSDAAKEPKKEPAKDTATKQPPTTGKEKT